MDLETDETAHLVDFLPSREMITMFMFFDQYAQSHNLWSPDGSKILFSGVPGRLEERGPLPDGSASSIFIADVGGNTEPELIGAGSIGVWSV